MLTEKEKELGGWLEDIQKDLWLVWRSLEGFHKALEQVPNEDGSELTTWEQCERCGEASPVIDGHVHCQPCERERQRGEDMAKSLMLERIHRKD